ncbi:HK97 gp10 family phage protein [Chryseomicrobium palamuruense]|uniref:HK97 gp10 family phage protein n=1 Tax=Chryseomicrobium palamuruense TaxID=682973 RepID=A0ABV8UVH9_9BACL
MGRRMGKVNLTQMKRFQKNLMKLNQADLDLFVESLAKELAARLLAKVIKRTPVGQYTDGTMGGTLRRGWTSHSQREAELSSAFGGGNGAKKFAESITVNKRGNTLVIEIINPVDYASYVEFGHRTRNHKGWVQGRFMLTISEQEIQATAPSILERKLKKKLGEIFK